MYLAQDKIGRQPPVPKWATEGQGIAKKSAQYLQDEAARVVPMTLERAMAQFKAYSANALGEHSEDPSNSIRSQHEGQEQVRRLRENTMQQSAIAADGMAGEAVLNDAIEGMGNVAGMVDALIKGSVKARKEGRLVARADGATSAVPKNEAGKERKYADMSVILQAAALVLNLILAGTWPARATSERTFLTSSPLHLFTSSPLNLPPLTLSQTAWPGSSTWPRTSSTL